MLTARPKSKSEKTPNIGPLAIASAVAFALAGLVAIVSANTNTTPDQFAQKAEVTAFTPAAPAKFISRSANGRVIDTNAFLRFSAYGRNSQMSSMHIEPFFGQVSAHAFTDLARLNTSRMVLKASTNYAGVGFPHIETNNRRNNDRYKPYKELLSFSSNADGEIVANVRCMGLSPVSVAKRAEKYEAKIFELAVKHRVSASLVKAVVTKESCFNPSARSRVGAIGLMQLMPATAKWLKVRNPDNANQNLEGGVRYLAQMRKRFGSDELALAAYNAGPGNVDRYNGIPPFSETQNYVKDVMHYYRGYVATTRFVNAMNAY